MGGRGETRAFDIETDKALSTGEAGRFWKVFPPPLTFLSTGRHYPARGRTKAQEENVRKALTPCSLVGVLALRVSNMKT